MPVPLPPPIFIPDSVDDSRLEYEPSKPVLTRGGYVTGLNPPASGALEQVFTATGMPPLGQRATIGGTTILLRKILAVPVSQDTLRVQLIYDNEGGTTGLYVIESKAFEQSYQTDLVPGTRDAIHIDDWVNPNDDKDTVKGDNVVITITRTMREVTVTGTKPGINPPMTFENAVGYANDGPWRGLATGYWRVTDGGTSISKYQGYYNFHCSALSKGNEDWSEIGILVSTKTGRKIKVDPDDLQQLLQPDYSYGIISNKPGIIRVGPYDTTNFSSLFGFS